MTTAQKQTNGKAATCDLRLRLIDDGSDLFASIASLPSNAARNIRATHLMYVGMLFESGRLFGGMQVLQGVPSANDAGVKVPVKAIKSVPNPVAAPAEIPLAEPVPEAQVHPDDLADFFPK